MASTNYTRGEMEIAEQSSTYGGFMNGTVYGGSALVVGLLYPILLFAVNLAWLPSLIACVILGIIIGLALKLKAGWYAGLIGLSVLTAIVSALVSMVLS